MHAAYGVVEMPLVDERREVLEHARHIVDLETEADGDATLVFGFERLYLVAVPLVVAYREGVGEGQRTVAAEAYGREAVRKGILHVFARVSDAVAVAAVGVEVGQGGDCEL